MSYTKINNTTEVRHAQLQRQLDNFSTFQWRGREMFKDFGVFIINDKKGSLKFYNGPGFSNEYSKPQFNNNGGDLVGVNFNRQTISFTVGVYWISVEKYRELMNCLDPLVTDYIIFDFEPRYRYNVKLSKIGDSTRWIVGYENGEPRYYTELSLTFDLQGDSCAKGVHSYEDNRSTGSNSSEVIITIDTTKKEFFESDLDTPFTISLPFLLAKEDTSDATKIIDEISLKATYDNEEINLFSVGLCNLNQQNYSSGQLLETLWVVYNSETGLIYLKQGSSQEKLITDLITTDSGEKMVLTHFANKFVIPGKFNFSSFDYKNFKLILSYRRKNKEDSTANTEPPSIVISALINQNNHFIECYPRTNVI